MTLPVMLAGCETLRFASAPAAPPPVPAPLPEPAAAPAAIRATPLPERKPPQRASITPVPPASSSQAGEGLPRAPVVVGLTRAGLIDQFGPPTTEREAAPARVLEFGDGDCRLAAYLYFDTTRNDFYTLQYEVNGLPAPNDAVDRCLSRIARDASRR
ncbi:MAG: hypothetical protein VW600_01640 [Ferrovibrio sp.]